MKAETYDLIVVSAASVFFQQLSKFTASLGMSD